MWWHERRKHGCKGAARIAGLALTLTMPILLAGCFQPLYGERTLTGSPGLRQHLKGVIVAPIEAPHATPEARIAVALRNALIFELTGGADDGRPTHRLKVQIAASRQQVIVDITSGRPDVELVGFQAHYSLTENATGRVVVTGSTAARASYDIPGQQQRFAGARGMLDAQERAAKVIADTIVARLASYFTAGT